MGIWLFALLTIFCGLAYSTEFRIYKCPLSSSASSLSSSANRECSSRHRRDVPYIPYGISHTYIEMDGVCYDWGDWNYPRQLSCNDSGLACCVKTRELVFRGTTSCNNIGAFERYWRLQNKQYNVLSWNSQSTVMQ